MSCWYLAALSKRSQLYQPLSCTSTSHFRPHLHLCNLLGGQNCPFLVPVFKALKLAMKIQRYAWSPTSNFVSFYCQVSNQTQSFCVEAEYSWTQETLW